MSSDKVEEWLQNNTGIQAFCDYYSEIITNVEYDGEIIADDHNDKRINNLWQVRTEKHCPIVINFPSITIPKIPLPTAERWITYPEDESIVFPRNTVEPKVQLMAKNRARELPRNVAIERLRRKFQSKNLKQYLSQFDIKTSDLISKQLLEKFEIPPFDSCENENFLPLELFDDKDYRCREPENWLEYAYKNGEKNLIPAEAFLPLIVVDKNDDNIDNGLFDLIDWINVAVDDYDFDKELWKIITLDVTKRVFYLPEIYVMFKAEDPEIFAKRIKKAVQLRYETEMELKYRFYLDNMILDGIPQPSQDILRKILQLSTRNNSLEYQKSFYIELENEYKLEYQITHCDFQIRHNVQINKDSSKFLHLPKTNWITMKIFGNYQNIRTGMVDFEKRRKYFQWMNIFVTPEIHQAMLKIIDECFKIENMSLFTINRQHLPLEEFEILQKQSVDSVIKFLQGSWVQNVASNIRKCIGKIDKGWYNIKQNKYKIYEIGKLIRFTELIKYRMQYSLRLFVTNTIETFINFIENPCLECLDLTDNYQWTNNVINSPFCSKYPPIFTLTINLISTNDNVDYSTIPELFQKSLLDLYDASLILTHQIPQIQAFLLDYLKFAKDLFLSSVGLLDEEVCRIRDRIMLAYQKVIIPLKAYLEALNLHLEPYKIDSNEYLRKYEEAIEEHTGNDVENEILHHRQMIDEINSTLPDHIIIGPFYIIVKDLKTTLILKREEIIGKLLDMFAQFLKLSVEKILEKYKYIMFKLNEMPENIETVFNLREWIDTLPLELEIQETLSQKYLNEYTILDSFFYEIPQEDFENTWEIISWPYKIDQQIPETNQFLKSEEERFYSIQATDVSVLKEKIEQFVVQIGEIFKLYDSNKANEITVDLDSLLEQMKKAEEFGKVLNMRQKLFELPLEPFDDLSSLIEEFETLIKEILTNHHTE